MEKTNCNYLMIHVTDRCNLTADDIKNFSDIAMDVADGVLKWDDNGRNAEVEKELLERMASVNERAYKMNWLRLIQSIIKKISK